MAEQKQAELLDGKPIHPLAAMFPPMSDDEFKAIIEDVREHGLMDPIFLYDGKILDGTHRLRACIETGTKPRYQIWDGEGGTPFQFVWSRNWSRRHLTTSQRAVVALEAQKQIAREAGAKTLNRPGGQRVVAKLPPVTGGKSRDAAGEMAGVSGRYVQEAKSLQKSHPELLEQVRLGKINLAAAKRRATKAPALKDSKKLTHYVRLDFDEHILTSERMAEKDAETLTAGLTACLPIVEGVKVQVIGRTSKASASKSANTASNMYADAQTWSPFKGCEYDCTYCVPTFQRQAKRQKNICQKCYKYAPHTHPERLDVGRIPSSDIVFVCGNADIAFCPPSFLTKIINAIKARNEMSRTPQTFYLQSKKPDCLKPFVKALPDNVILVTTLETNRDEGYDKVSKAPLPTDRYKQFLALEYPRKVVTIEPVMDFDVTVFTGWIMKIKPEYVWLGLNSQAKSAPLPEPSEAKLREFAAILRKNGIRVRGKTLRGMVLPGVTP